MFCHVTGCYCAYNPGLTDAMICSMPSNRSFVSSYLCYKHIFFFTFHFCSSSDVFFLLPVFLNVGTPFYKEGECVIVWGLALHDSAKIYFNFSDNIRSFPVATSV